MFGDGASNQGTFGETLNLAALWKLPVVFMVTNNQFGMGTALERHSAVTDLQRKGEGFGVPGMRCDGMDVLDTYARDRARRSRSAREDRRPMLVEAVTYRFRGHSMADPEEYRTKEQVAEWRKRDPIAAFGERLDRARACSTRASASRSTSDAIARVDEAVAFADSLALPGARVAVRRRLRARRPGARLVLGRRALAGVHRGEDERDSTERDAERGRRRARPQAHERRPRLPPREDERTRRRGRAPDGRRCATARRSTRRCARRCSATSASS